MDANTAEDDLIQIRLNGELKQGEMTLIGFKFSGLYIGEVNKQGVAHGEGELVNERGNTSKGNF